MSNCPEKTTLKSKSEGLVYGLNKVCVFNCWSSHWRRDGRRQLSEITLILSLERRIKVYFFCSHPPSPPQLGRLKQSGDWWWWWWWWWDLHTDLNIWILVFVYINQSRSINTDSSIFKYRCILFKDLIVRFIYLFMHLSTTFYKTIM